MDLIVIGGGPGGYVAAIRAAQLGLQVTLVEREALGGVCLNWGCIPTKALLRSAEIKHYLDHAADYGLMVGAAQVDLAAVVQRSRTVASQLSDGVKFLLKKNKVTVVSGTAQITGPGLVTVATPSGEQTLTARNILIATGARAREAGPLKADGQCIWTYKQAMVPEAIPARLLVVGSGAIGVEFASFYRDLGAKVTLVEALDRILPVEDAEIAAMVAKSFTQSGMEIHTGATLSALAPGTNDVTATWAGGDGTPITRTFDRAILAIGIVPNTENLGLETLGVALDRGHIVTDGYGRTNVDGVWAIGDVTGAPWLAHKASHEGVIAAEAMAGYAGVHPLDKANIPGCTYSRPQVASVGLTEAAALSAGHSVRVGRFPFRGNGKAIALGESEGLVKTIFDATTGALLGAHLVGAEVTELIHSFTLARTLETTEAELMATVFPHPTLSEMLHESVLDAYGRALHI